MRVGTQIINNSESRCVKLVFRVCRTRRCHGNNMLAKAWIFFSSINCLFILLTFLSFHFISPPPLSCLLHMAFITSAMTLLSNIPVNLSHLVFPSLLILCRHPTSIKKQGPQQQKPAFLVFFRWHFPLLCIIPLASGSLRYIGLTDRQQSPPCHANLYNVITRVWQKNGSDLPSEYRSINRDQHDRNNKIFRSPGTNTVHRNESRYTFCRFLMVYTN